MKEAYGKIKKEENVNVQSSTKQKPLVVKFNNVAFVEEHGERFWFFKTHVIPGNSINCNIFFSISTYINFLVLVHLCSSSLSGQEMLAHLVHRVRTRLEKP